MSSQFCILVTIPIYGYLMSRDAKSLTSTLAAFYVVGAFLALLAYAFNSFDYFVIILGFWIKETLAIVFIGMGYWLYYIICSSLGRPPNAPLRFLGRAFFVLASRAVFYC